MTNLGRRSSRRLKEASDKKAVAGPSASASSITGTRRTTSSGKNVHNGVPKPARIRKKQTTVTTAPLVVITAPEVIEKARTKRSATVFNKPGQSTKLLSARQSPDRWWLVTKSLTARPDQMVLSLYAYNLPIVSISISIHRSI